MLRRMLAALVASLATSCSSGPVTGAGQSPPEWAGPTSVVVGQGRTVRVPVSTQDADGDAVTVTLAAVPDGLEAELDAEASELVLHASYAVAGSADLSVHLTDDTGEEASVRLAITVPPLEWVEHVEWGPEGPEAREHGAVIVDAERRRVLLFGGSGYAPYLSPLADLWQFDLDARTWMKLEPSGDVPSGGGSRRVAQLPGRATAYLFGGYGVGAASHAELYRVDFAGDVVFTRVEQSPLPFARSLHAFAYDAVADRFVAFGGAGSFVHGDTLTMRLVDGVAQWTEYGTLSPSPSPRYGFFSGYDADVGRLVVWSGAQGTSDIDPAADAWALDARTDPPRWERLHDGVEPGSPPGRRNGATVFDPTGPRLVVFGGTADARTSEPGLFSLDLRPSRAEWTRIDRDGEPPVRSSGFGFHDRATGRLYLGFGNTSTGRFRDLGVLGY